jgi:hypothetical protein
VNGYSTRNYQLKDEESIGRMAIPQGIASSETMNPPEEWDSAGNYQLIDEESTPEEWYSVGNYFVIDADSDQ